MYNINIMREVGHTVDGKKLHQVICSLSHYLQGFIHPRWCRISSINSIIPHLDTTLKEWKRLILAVIWIDRLTRIYPACKIEILCGPSWNWWKRLTRWATSIYIYMYIFIYIYMRFISRGPNNSTSRAENSPWKKHQKGHLYGSHNSIYNDGAVGGSEILHHLRCIKPL